MSEACIHFIVKGKVQGVWFRAHTEQQGRSLGLTGWVRNLPDGNVEVLACGEDEALTQFQDWLWQGPPKAQVESVIAEKQPWQAFEDFIIK